MGRNAGSAYKLPYLLRSEWNSPQIYPPGPKARRKFQNDFPQQLRTFGWENLRFDVGERINYKLIVNESSERHRKNLNDENVKSVINCQDFARCRVRCGSESNENKFY